MFVGCGWVGECDEIDVRMVVDCFVGFVVEFGDDVEYVWWYVGF